MGFERIALLGPAPAATVADPNDDLLLSGWTTAARFLEGRAPVFEFVSRRETKFQQLTEKYADRRTRVGILGGAGVATILVGGLAWQAFSLSRLEARWEAMEPQVQALESLQKQIRDFRPWYRSSAVSLEILRQLTEAFPEEGSVWAKNIEIKDDAQVSCAGFARSNQAFMEMLDRLRSSDAVQDVQVKQVRGANPIQFTISFVWNHAAQN
jgi:Tfp pilus assembly protein PilN